MISRARRSFKVSAGCSITMDFLPGEGVCSWAKAQTGKIKNRQTTAAKTTKPFLFMTVVSRYSHTDFFLPGKLSLKITIVLKTPFGVLVLVNK